MEEEKSDAEEEIDVVPAVRRSTRPIKKKKLIQVTVIFSGNLLSCSCNISCKCIIMFS